MLTSLLRALCVVLMMAVPSLAASSPDNPFALPLESHEQLLKGFDLLFNSDFEAAEQTLLPLKSGAERHPMFALAQLTVIWWRMSSNVLDGDDAESKKFVDAAEATMKLAQARLEKDPSGEANFVMGTTLGLLSRWSAANRAWVPAYFRGNKSTGYSERALKKNRLIVDAYLTLGTFNYARALLLEQTQTPSQNGKPEKEDPGQTGLDQLRKVYEKGVYFRPAAGLLLGGILANDKPPEAPALLENLKKELPRSAFVQMILITALYNNGEIDRMEQETKDFSDKIETGIYSRWYAPHAYFARGLIAFRKKKWDDARREFDGAIDADQKGNPYSIWAVLYKGYALDAMGKRAKAKAQYEAVLKLPRRFASHDHAHERLAKPFRPTDPEMTKVEL